METKFQTSQETAKAIEAVEAEMTSTFQSWPKDQNGSRNEFWKSETYNKISARQRELKKDLHYQQIREIKKFANYCMYSDVHPYEVVRIVSDKTVIVRAMATKQTKFPKEFHAGGFVGHYADNRSGQDYAYFSDPSLPEETIRWSEAKRQWQATGGRRFAMSDAPYKFHDYNF